MGWGSTWQPPQRHPDRRRGEMSANIEMSTAPKWRDLQRQPALIG